jgi:hypothetical protein
MKRLLSAMVMVSCVAAPARAQSRAAAPPPEHSARAAFRSEANSRCPLFYDATSVAYDVVFGDSAGEYTVLEQTRRIRRCINAEGEDGRVTVVARRVGHPGAPPLWRIEVEGDSSGLYSPGMVDTYYRVHQQGCCGVQDLNLYFDLKTGRQRLASTLPLLRYGSPGTGEARIGFRGNYSATELPEFDRDSTVIGILQLDDGRAVERLVLHGPPGYHSVDELTLEARAPGGTQKTDAISADRQHPAPGPVFVAVTVQPDDGAAEPSTIRVPIVNGHLAPAQAELPRGFRLLPATPYPRS